MYFCSSIFEDLLFQTVDEAFYSSLALNHGHSSFCELFLAAKLSELARFAKMADEANRIEPACPDRSLRVGDGLEVPLFPQPVKAKGLVCSGDGPLPKVTS